MTWELRAQEDFNAADADEDVSCVICPPPLALELEAEELPDVVDSASTLLAANATGPALTRLESNCERKPRLKIRRAHTNEK
jgi:hypothetical protein